MAQDPIAVVRAFCDAWSRRDPEEIASWFTDDGVYHNIPMEPARGRQSILNLLRFILAPAQRVEFEIKGIAADGNTVFTERVDRFEMNGKRVELPVAGVFEVEGESIRAWRDYFDLATWTRQAT